MALQAWLLGWGCPLVGYYLSPVTPCDIVLCRHGSYTPCKRVDILVRVDGAVAFRVSRHNKVCERYPVYLFITLVIKSAPDILQ